MRALILDELDKTFNGSVSRIVDGGGLFAGRVQLEGGEPADIIGDVIESCIAFGDNDFVRVGGICSSELFVFRSEVLAMATLRVSEMEGGKSTHGA